MKESRTRSNLERTGTRSDGQFLNKSYSDQLGTIRRLYASIPEFADICRDYEEIATLIAQRPKDENPSTAADLADLQGTLDGLSGEIEAYLSSPDHQ